MEFIRLWGISTVAFNYKFQFSICRTSCFLYSWTCIPLLQRKLTYCQDIITPVTEIIDLLSRHYYPCNISVEAQQDDTRGQIVVIMGSVIYAGVVLLHICTFFLKYHTEWLSYTCFLLKMNHLKTSSIVFSLNHHMLDIYY